MAVRKNEVFPLLHLQRLLDCIYHFPINLEQQKNVRLVPNISIEKCQIQSHYGYRFIRGGIQI